MVKTKIIYILKLISRFWNRIKSLPVGNGGALKSPQDDRDYIAGSISNIDLPDSIDLRQFVPEVKEQGNFNSCVSHTICSAIEFQFNMKDPRRYLPLSERYNYYFGRKLCGGNLVPPNNNGMYIRDAIKSAKKRGVALEMHCPYNIDMNQEPSNLSEVIANYFSKWLTQYYRVWTKVDMKKQLILGYPVLITVPFYDYWTPTYNGFIRKPLSFEKSKGYHNLLVVGYDAFGWICLNSWGDEWGDQGFCYIPYSYKIVERWIIEVI